MSAGASQIRAGRAYVEATLDDAKLRSGMDRAAARLNAWGKSLQGTGLKLFGAGAAASAPFAAGAKSFADYEQSLAELRAAANPTAAEMEKVKASIDAISKSTGTGQNDVASAFTELLKAGTSVEVAMGGAAEAAVKFARIGGIDVAEAVTVTNDALNVFAKEGLSATQAVDILSKAADASSISVEQVAQAFSQVSAVAGLAGQTMADTANAIAVLGNAGVKGSDAGTSLKTMLVSLMAPSEVAAGVIAQLSLNFRDATGQIKPLRGVVAELQRGLGTLDTASQQDALKNLFGTDALRAGAILLGQGVKGWDEFGAKINDSLTVSQKFGIVTDTLKEKALSLWSAVERVASAVGEAYGPALKSAAGEATAVATALADFAADNKGVIVAVASVAAGLTLAGAALVSLGTAMSVAGFASASMVTAIKGLGSALSLLSANPGTVVLIGVAAVAAAVGSAMYRAANYTAEFTNAFDAALKKGDEARRVDADRLARLEKLGQADRLNADQMREAADLISKLQGKYGDLGLRLDQATGKVNGLREAHERLNAQMRAVAISEAKAAVAEAEANYRETDRQRKSENSGNLGPLDNDLFKAANWNTLWAAIRGQRSGIQSSEGMDKAHAAGLRLKATLERLKALQSGDQAALFGGAKSADSASRAEASAAAIARSAESTLKAQEDLADLNEREADKRRSDLDREIAAIRKVGDERRKLLAEWEAGERARIGGPRQAALDGLARQRREADKDERRDEAEARAKAAREAAKTREDFDSDLRRRQAQQDVAEAQAKVEAAAGDDKVAAEKELLAARRRAAAEDAAQYKREAVARAVDAFKGDPVGYFAAVDQIDQLAQRMADVKAGADAVAAKFSAVGTFSAAAAARIGGSGDYQARTAKAAEKLPGLLKDVVRAIEKVSGVKFG